MANVQTLDTHREYVKPESIQTTYDYKIPQEVVDQEAARLAPQYGLNPDGSVNENNVKALLFDPEQVKKENERKMKDAKIARWFSNVGQALGTITDIVSAAKGGDVVRRPKDNTPIEAGEKEDALREENENLGSKYRRGVAGLQQAYAKALNDRMDKLRPMYKQTNKDYNYRNMDADGTRQVVVKDNNGNDNGNPYGVAWGTKGKRMRYNVRTNGNQMIGIDMPEYVAKNAGNAIYVRLKEMAQDPANRAIIEKLKADGIVETKTDGMLKPIDTFQLARLIGSGYVFDDPYIDNIILQLAEAGLQNGSINQAQYNNILNDRAIILKDGTLKPKPVRRQNTTNGGNVGSNRLAQGQPAGQATQSTQRGPR